MWLKRLQKSSSNSPDGGAGGGSGGSIPVFEGQGSLFGSDVNRDPSVRKENKYNAKKDNANKRRQKRKILERKREWRSSRDRQ